MTTEPNEIPPALTTSRTASPLSGAALWVVLLAALICFGSHIAQPNFQTHDELFYMTGALTANETGDWLVPTYRNDVRLKKPPLQYWLVGISYRLFGVGAWQGRLPSVLSGVAAVGLVCWLSRLLFGSRRAGLYAACVLLSSFLFLRQAHLAITDVVLATLILLAFCGYAAAWKQNAVRGPVLAWAAMGLAVLQKGPIGLLLPLGTIVCWHLQLRRDAPLSWRQIFNPYGMLLFLAVVLPWPLLAMHRLGLDRFAAPVTEEMVYHLNFSAGRALQYCLEYMPDLLLAIFPWSLLLVASLVYRESNTATRLLWTWCGLLVFVVSFALLKRRMRYLIPAVPSLAMLAGWALANLESRAAPAGRAWRWVVGGAQAWFAGAVVVAVPLGIAATGLIRTREALLVAGLLPGFALGMLALLRLMQRRVAPSTYIVAVAVGMAMVNTLGGISIHAAFPEQPAYTLARRHLHGVDPREIAVAGLHPDELSWAWIGAGHSFGPGATIAAKGISEQPGWLLASRTAVAELPPENLALYTEVESSRGGVKGLSLTKVITRLDELRSEWEHKNRDLVLLRR